MENTVRSSEAPQIDDDLPSIPKPPRTTKRGFTVRRMMLGVAVVAFGIGVIRPIYLVWDALNHGPYVTAYNRRCLRIAQEAHLIGRPERDVELVLGPASYLHDQVPGSTKNTYNYLPVKLCPTAKFQVHCIDGIVTGLEQFDD